MAQLYPPQINGTIPAFYNDEGTAKIVVPFSMNRAVSFYEIEGMYIKIKSLTGAVIGVLSSANIDESNMEVTFNVSSLINKFTIGSFYKIQVAYIEKTTHNTGYYSTVGVIKYTAKPSVYIDGLSLNKINNNKFVYTGVYKQEQDATEKLYSSRFIIYDDDVVFYDTGEKLHDNTQDDLRNEAHEVMSMPIELEINKSYTISFLITTVNGIKIRTNRYRIIHRRSLDPEIKADLIATLNFENGYISLTLKDEVDKIISGTFVISRCSNINNWIWETIKDFQLSSTPPEDFEFKDMSIEQGVLYKYSIQQYNKTTQIYSNKIVSNLIEADFEDAFLYDGERQLRIRFNPKISSLKTDIQEAKQETIGHKYPFFTRNSHINYKEFPISGLISYLMDDNEMFIKKEEIGLELIEQDSQYQTYGEDRKTKEWSSTTDLTSRNISAERVFKLTVLDWLNNGKIKAFRSPGEGNYLVRLMSVSLSPNDTLSRMLHTFSCTAYEVADFTLENLASFGIYNFIETEGTERRWTTINLYEQILNEAYDWTNPSTIPEWLTIIENANMTEIFTIDMLPGDKIRVDDEEIVMGATGSYRVQNELNPFHKIEISTTITSGLLTYGYDAKTTDSFAQNIDEFIMDDVPCAQFIGNNYQQDVGENLLNSIQDIRTNILSINMLRVIKRPIIDGFVEVDETSETPLTDLNLKILDYINFGYKIATVYIEGQTYYIKTSNGYEAVTLNSEADFNENTYYYKSGLDIEEDNFSFTTATGDEIFVKNYNDIYNRPYELPIYQLRAKRINKKEQFTEYEILNLEGISERKIYYEYDPYTFEQYYIDKHMDKFYPYLGFYFDPYQGKIFEVTDNLFQFTINENIIEVKDIETWELKNVDPIPESIILNNGVYAELAYTKSTCIYSFENSNSKLYNKNLDKIKENFEEAMVIYLLSREGAKNYSDITAELLNYLKLTYPKGSLSVDSRYYYSNIGSKFITDVCNDIENANENPDTIDRIFKNYYNGADKVNSNAGLFNLRKLIKINYQTYINMLKTTIENYKKEQGMI